MAIDRIGKGGGIPQAPDTGAPGTDKAGGASAPFKVERTERAAQTHGSEGPGRTDATAAASPATPATPLARLRAGEVDVNGYVDLKVDEATKNLKGLSPAEVGDIKNVLRDQMRSDPGLSDLVREATGKSPSPPEE
ncbi:MAG: hypothetical protein JWP97_3204 [Labilithrix sp.]|nr:hypothetical protein [Labilithrix sp.]